MKDKDSPLPSADGHDISAKRQPAGAPVGQRKAFSSVLNSMPEKRVVSSELGLGTANEVSSERQPAAATAPVRQRKPLSSVLTSKPEKRVVSPDLLEDNHSQPPSDDDDLFSERQPVEKRKASSTLHTSVPKVRMVCEGVSRPEFFIDSDEDADNPDAVGAGAADTNAAPRRKRVDAPRANARKRSIQSSQWKSNVAKQGYNDGAEYVTSRGAVKPARQIKPPCSGKCNRCQRFISENERQDIFQNFWALESITAKRDYISRLIDENVPATCSTSPDCAKKSIRKYHFVIGDEEVRVCKTMFINTLGIADVWIETTLKKITPNGLKPDGRGKHNKRPTRTPPETLDSVRKHIELFPKVYSHYTRERSKREYLETQVHSVERMHKLYLEWAPENTNAVKLASLSTYRKIFNTEFNLGFFLPRKDQCETCAKWKTCNQEDRRQLVQDYAAHLQNKKMVNDLKKMDKASANETKCVACFDLQKVLICPRSEVSLFFYHNKLSLFNFTVFDLRLAEGHCYLWTEVDAGKGSNEIGTNLLHFIEKKVNEGVKEFILYSDSPSGQNRNRMIFSMYLFASAKYNIRIVHRFLESGHSYSEADSMHGRIENEAKVKQTIYTPEEWATLIGTAKQSGKPYIMNNLRNEDVLDLHSLVDKEDWDKNSRRERVFWSRVREVAADCKSPNTIFYRYDFASEPSKVLVKLKSGGTTNMKNYKFPPAYKAKLPMSEKKKKDLRNLMRKGAIPAKYHATFESYLSI